MGKRQHSGLTDQRKASIHRLEYAEALFRAGRWRGSMYLAGYAVECRLKYKLMQRWRCFHLEELEEKLAQKGFSTSPFTHNLELLLEMAGGSDRLHDNLLLWRRFTRTINRWQPAWRYDPDLGTSDEAELLLTATKEFIHWLDHNL